MKTMTNKERINTMDEFQKIETIEQYKEHASYFVDILDNDYINEVVKALNNGDNIYMCETNDYPYTKEEVLEAYYNDVEYRLNDYSYSYDYMLITDYDKWFDRVVKLNSFERSARLNKETPKLVKALQGIGLAYIDRNARVYTLDEVEKKLKD